MEDSQGIDILEKEEENKEQGSAETDPQEASALSKQEYEDVTDLVLLMDEHDLVEIEYEGADHRIRLKKKGANQQPPPAQPATNPAAGTQPPATHQRPNPPASAQTGDETGTAGTEQQTAGTAEDTQTIKAPLVGTFYRAPSPDAESFVEVGDEVDEETVVCIIEAMKVMNEIKAETSGTVERILVDNGEAVDFDEPLIEISPAD